MINDGFKGRILKDSSAGTSLRTRRSFMIRTCACPTGTAQAILPPPNVTTSLLSITGVAPPGVTSLPKPRRMPLICNSPTRTPRSE